MILFADNPDYYNTATLERYWDGTDGFGSPGGTAGVRSDGYLGRPALTSTGGDSFVKKIPMGPFIHPSFPEFRIGARFLFEAFPAAPVPILMALNGLGEIQVCATINPDGTLSIYRGTAVTELAQSVTALSVDTFYRIGFKGFVSRDAGFASIRINETTVANVTGANTAESDNIPWSSCAWGLVEDSAVNHVYMGDAFGHQPDLIPGLLVDNIFPSATTDVNQWIPNTGTVPAAIDDAVPDDDTTYIYAELDHDAFLVQMGTLGPVELIYAVQSTARVKNVLDDTTRFRHLFGDAGAVFEGSYERGCVTANYLVHRDLFYQQFANGNAWTTDAVNATTFGGRVIT